MKSSILIKVIRNLPPSGEKELTDFLNSPFFRNKKETIDLWRFIQKRLEGKKEELTKANAFAAVFPGKKYEDQIIRRVMSQLLRTIEQMISVNRFLGNKNAQKLNLLTFYREKGIEVQFKKHLRSLRADLSGETVLNLEELQLIPKIEFENYRLNETGKRDFSMNLEEVNDAYDIAFIAGKLRLACLVHAHKSLFKTDYKIAFLEETLIHLDENLKRRQAFPLIELYYFYHKSLTEKSFKPFFKKFRKLLSANLEFLTDQAQTEFLIYAINFCIRKYNTGDIAFLAETFSLYKEGLEKSVFVKTGNIGRFTFKNIVTTALKLREYDWAADFIQNYTPKLGFAYRKDFGNFCEAHLAYSLKDYDRAMTRLNAVNPKDLFMSIGAKLMLVKIYFEKGEYDAVHFSIASFKKFLQRKQVVAYHRENYLKIISFIEKLILLNRFDAAAAENLKNDILENAPIPERDWLLGQF